MIGNIISKMLIDQPFFANIILQMRKHETNSVDVAAVSDTTLYYNKNGLSKYSEQEQKFILCHEALHVALKHTSRKNGRHDKKWNYACDTVVNTILYDYFNFLPKFAVRQTNSWLTAEEVYDKLGDADKFDVMFSDLKNLNDTGDEQTVESIKKYVQSNFPKKIKRFFQHLEEKPKINWKVVLSDFFNSVSLEREVTWQRFSRRVDGMPFKKRLKQTKIGIAIDTSGSIDNDLMSQFTKEVNAIKKSSGIKTIVVTSDAEVHQVFEDDDDLSESFDGGGGTDFVPAVEYLSSREVDAIIYFTDGYGNYPEKNNLPIFWCLTSDCETPKHGISIRME
jgi:predicted metal-dependent peptidase